MTCGGGVFVGVIPTPPPRHVQNWQYIDFVVHYALVFAPFPRNGRRFFLHACELASSSAMGFETVWFSRKNPKPTADGVKGKVISGKGTRECR
jgi:hypothetical protein